MKFNQIIGMGMQKPFNMDALTLERINDKLDKCNNATIEGDMLARFRAISTVYLHTKFKYTDEEKAQIEPKIKEINNMFKNSPNTHNRQSRIQYYATRTDVIEDKLFILEGELVELLYKNDLIHLKRSKRLTPEQEVEQEYE